MKVFFHFSVAGFSNSYLLGPDTGGDAILIDPGVMDGALLNLVEGKGYYVRDILFTHSHTSHVSGLRTIMKIYDCTIYAAADQIVGFPCNRLSGGDTIELSGFTVGALSVRGHSRDSIVYVIDNCLFTGDVMGAGTIGSTPNGYAQELLINQIRQEIFALKDQYSLFPGHGAPSTLEVERTLNPRFL
ncbi:MAG: hypothetical protein CMN78_01180 [Spirochaetales bacterium]|nr:hypothetical protein [Spirochaetales bacterium]